MDSHLLEMLEFCAGETEHPLPFRGGAVRLGPAQQGLSRSGVGVRRLRRA